MSLIKIILIFFLILFSISLIMISFYIYSCSQIEIKEVKINNLQEISLKGFTFNGEINVYNSGFLPINIKKINYKLKLENSDTILSVGQINGKKISPKKTETFSFSARINWIPSIETALSLITPGKTYAKFSGTILVTDLGITEIKLPFEKKIDLETYIKQFVKEKIKKYFS